MLTNYVIYLFFEVFGVRRISLILIFKDFYNIPSDAANHCSSEASSSNTLKQFLRSNEIQNGNSELTKAITQFPSALDENPISTHSADKCPNVTQTNVKGSYDQAETSVVD